jgi:hypothetical protein
MEGIFGYLSRLSFPLSGEGMKMEKNQHAYSVKGGGRATDDSTLIVPYTSNIFGEEPSSSSCCAYVWFFSQFQLEYEQNEQSQRS